MKTYTNTGNKDTRSGFGAGLEVLGQQNPNVVALCADLTGSLKMNAFKDNHPERFIQVVKAILVSMQRSVSYLVDLTRNSCTSIQYD